MSVESSRGPQPTVSGPTAAAGGTQGGAPNRAPPFIRPILVGEQNQLDADRRFDLYPLPEHSAGGRLCRKILGMRLVDYLKTFERVNLLGSGKWDPRAARERAQAILAEHADRIAVGGRLHLVLLGAKVCAAFDLGYLVDFSSVAPGGVRWAALRLPHPSGRCRVWNDPAAYDQARLALKLFLPDRVSALVGTVVHKKEVAS